MNKQISKEQIQEWLESPVADHLADLVNTELQEIRDTPITQAVCYGEPVKSHENLVELQARELAWVELALVLDGDWSYFEEEEEDGHD